MVPPARGQQRDSCRSGICQRGGVAVKHAMVATATRPRTVDTNGRGGARDCSLGLEVIATMRAFSSP